MFHFDGVLAVASPRWLRTELAGGTEVSVPSVTPESSLPSEHHDGHGPEKLDWEKRYAYPTPRLSDPLFRVDCCLGCGWFGNRHIEVGDSAIP
jgi:hypothetical protein